MTTQHALGRIGAVLAVLLLLAAMPPAKAQEAAGTTPARFAVSPDGVATYSIPLVTPPGTAGVEPKLSLVYSSRGGTSAYGFGWSLSGLSQIQRGPRNLTDDGTVVGVRLSADDAFYLDGEKLVEVSSGSAGVREYRTRIDTLVRVRSYQANAAGPSYFVVETRAGLKMTYGAAASARVSLTDGRTITWLAQRIEDRSGNYMTFAYRFDTAGGQGLDYVLARVDYTGNDAVGLAPYASIIFDYQRLEADKAYGDRYLIGQRAALGWRLRSIVSSYRGSVLRRYTPGWTSTSDSDRFATLATLEEQGADGLRYRPLKFDYPRSRPGWQPSDLLGTIQDLPGIDELIANFPKSYRFARLPKGTSTVPAVLVSADMAGKTVRKAYLHDAATGQWKPEKDFVPPVIFAASAGEATDVVLVDVDGDGDDDILSGAELSGNIAATWIATADGWQQGPALPVPLTGGTLAASGVIDVDAFDGAGTKRLAFAWNHVDPTSRQRVSDTRRWDGGAWVSITGYTPPSPFSAASGLAVAGARAIDVDADGARELVYYDVAGGAGAPAVYRATTTGWRPLVAPANYLLPLPSLPSDSALKLADMNGDGRADLVYAFETAAGQQGGIELARSTGWLTDARTLPAVAFWRPGDNTATGVSGEVVDLDGDGAQDFVDILPGGYVAWRAQGDQWVRDDKLTPPTTLGGTTAERSTGYALLRLPGSGAWTWLGLRPTGGLAPQSYRFDAAVGWRSDVALKVPVDLAQFDKVDLGIRFLDLNNDGLPDLVWARRKKDGSVDSAVYLFQPGAKDPWKKDVRYILPAPLVREDYLATGTFVADVDGDGRVDLIEARRTIDRGRVVDRRETWINCAALPACADVAADKVSGYWLPVSSSPSSQGLVPPTVFAEDGVGPLGAQTLDVNGDGLTDIVTARELEAWVDEAGQDVAADAPGAIPVYRLEARTWLNDQGRGWIESAAFRLPVPLVRPLVRGETFGEPSDDAPFPGVTVVETRALLMDLDGDRLPDLSYRYQALRKVRSETGPVVVERVAKQGARLGTNQGWTVDAVAYQPPVRLDEDPSAPNRQMIMEDLNGDGSIDLAFADGANSASYLNTGVGWSSADAAFKIPAEAIRAGKGDQGFRIFDLNGDMLPDIAYHWTMNGGAQRGAFINTGVGWAKAPADFAPSIPFAEQDRGDIGVRPLDVNGDGLLDLVQSYKRSGSETRNQVQVNTSDRPYLLTRATNGLGASTQVTYRSFLTIQRPSELAAAAKVQVRIAPGAGRPSVYPIVHAPLPGYLVGEVLEQGVGISPRRLRYAYDGNRVDIRSGRSLGFDTTRVEDVERGRVTLTTFSQDDATLGSPIRLEVRQDGRLIAETDSVWRVEAREGLSGSTGVTGFAPMILRRNLGSTASKAYELGGILTGGEATAFTYDANGNPLTVGVTFADGSGSVTENSYADDTASWALARLSGTRVTLSAPGRSDQVREARFGYDPASGLMLWERALVGTGFETETRYARDGFGNKVSSRTSPADGSLARTESLAFDAEGRFAIRATNTLGHVSQMRFDPVSGAVLTRTDPNGLVQQSRYDSLQRETAQVSTAGVITDITTSFSSLPGTVLITTRLTPGLPVMRSWADAAGRPVRTEQTGWRGRVIIAEMRYDALGRAIETTQPRFQGEPALVAKRTYDELDRLTSETRPDGAVASIDYRGLDQISTDVVGARTIKRSDLRGRIRETVDAMGGVTRFEFDVAGRGIATLTVAGQTIRQAYDVAGNRVALEDPSTGRWAYAYDVHGRMVRQVDPRGEVTELTYDTAGRLVAKRTKDSTSTWTYDRGPNALGRLTATAVNGGHRREIAYDRLGRATRTKATNGRDVLVTRYRFDVFGRVTERRFDTGVTLSYRYDAQGQMVGVSLNDGSVRRDVYGLVEVDAAGRVTAERMGNGIVTKQRFDPLTGLLAGSVTRAGQADVQALTLEYDLVGNLTAMADGATADTGRFGYDQLRRLTHVAQSGREDINVSYDALGNITSKTNAGVYGYCDRGALKGLLCSVTGPAGAIAMDYDAAGNTIRSGERVLTFGSDGKVAEIKGPSGTRSRFSYDGDGQLLTQDSLQGPTQHRYETRYFGDVQLIRENYAPPGVPTPERTIVRHALASATGVFGYYDKVYRHYPYRFAAAIYGQVMTQKPERVTDLRYGFSYLVKDHLGSIRAVLSEDGKVIDRFRYDPWGLRIEGSGYRYRDIKQGFTGHEMLDGVDLIHMGGRVYDPLIGRFMSADPYIQAPLFSQSYNRYSYVMNNPLVMVDPNGYWSLGGAIGGFFRGVGNAFRDVVDAVVGKPLAWVGEQLAKGGRWLQQNWQTVAIIAIACVMPAATVWYAAVLQGAALGALSAALYGGGPDEILRGALIGGATGGAFYGVGSAGVQNRALAAGAHGVVGGVSSVAQGGDFQSGFLSAAVTKFSGSYVDPNAGQAYQVASAAVIGGVASEIGGGSFENGAITGAFSRLFNDCAHELQCGFAKGAQPSQFEHWVASLPDIPPEFSNAIQGFGSGLSFGATEWINEQLGAGAYVDKNSIAFISGEATGMAYFAAVNLYGAATGAEIRLGANVRLAPWGNRGPDRIQYPHYHRRGMDPATNTTRPGQGIGRHRPWEVKRPDTSFWDRF